MTFSYLAVRHGWIVTMLTRYARRSWRVDLTHRGALRTDTHPAWGTPHRHSPVAGALHTDTHPPQWHSTHSPVAVALHTDTHPSQWHSAQTLTRRGGTPLSLATATRCATDELSTLTSRITRSPSLVTENPLWSRHRVIWRAQTGGKHS